jgi:uncharacterized protein (TIGR02099 family)
MASSDQTETNPIPPEEEEFSPLAEFGVAPQRRGLVRRLLHFTGYVLLIGYFGFAAALLALRFWVLPYAETHPELIAQEISRNIGQRVSIGSVDSGWQRLRPYLALTELRLYDSDGRIALSLPSVSCTLSWDSLAFGTLRFHSLSLDKPDLNIRRDQAGTLYVAGVKLDAGAAGAGAGFSEWLMEQREVDIRDARVSWDDQLRHAPTLLLSNVNFLMRNRGSHHRFALRARPPREIGAVLNLRGDLQGRTLQQLQAWNGEVYAELADVDLAAWRAWIDYPVDIESGRGGLRLWLRFANKRPVEVTADVALGGFSARLAPELPALSMRLLQGRLSAKHSGAGYEFAGDHVAMELRTGAALPPTQFELKWRPGGASGAEQGELQVDALALRPLALLGGYLPLPQDLREFLADAAPEGSISGLRFTWQGPLQNPQHYSARGHFDHLGMRAYAGLPGFSGISGNIDGNETSGNVSINASNAQMDMRQVFAETAPSFDSFTGELSWSHVGDGLRLRFSNIAFANADLTGTAFGTYLTADHGPGTIDLTVRLSRADARHVARYIPFLDKDAFDWLDRGLLAGTANDFSLRLKGNLKDFPFESAKEGTFQIAGKVVDASLRYAAGWPTIDGIDANLRFDGRGMEVTSNKASVLGARVTAAHVVLADLFGHDRVLTVNGQAEGPTAAFLKFVAQSPVNKMIGGVTENMSALGKGKLRLKLDLPLGHLDDAKIAGSYLLLGNQVRIDPDWPAVSQVSGRLEFTDGGVSMHAVKARFLGGPAVVGIATRPDGNVAVNAYGTLDAAALQSALGQPLLRRLRGTTAWRSSMNFGKRGASILVQSDLQGIVSTLPAPLAKESADSLPLRFEYTASTGERESGWSGAPSADRSTLDLGDIVRMEVQRHREDGKMVIVRGAIGLNEAPRLPEAGMVLNGKAKELDLDEWLSALARAGGGSQLPLSLLDLKVGALDVYGKRIHDVSLRAGFKGSDWLATIDARELAGDVRWRSQGKGRVSAHFTHFTFPEPTPGKVEATTSTKELPALDIVADNLIVGDKKLGRLELTAANEGLDWRIDRLTLTTPEASLSADGLWGGVAAQQRTSVNLKLEVHDVGKYLARLGYPGTVQRGNATLQGKLSWAGAPQNIDYPTLAGNLTLTAEKGQFLKIKTGISKLLGILSLQELPRRITLDFRDIFSEGFAFDTISADATVADGVLHTNNFVMQGPSAHVAMLGDIDLAHETQALKVRVVPSVGDSLAVAGGLMLASPIAGVASLVAQRLLKDPLGQVFAYGYSITGTWADPKVEKLGRETPAGTTHAPPADSVIEVK